MNTMKDLVKRSFSSNCPSVGSLYPTWKMALILMIPTVIATKNRINGTDSCAILVIIERIKAIESNILTKYITL